MKVLITRQIPGDYLDKFENSGFEVDIWKEDRPMPREVFLEKVVGVDALLCLLTEKVDREVFDRAGANLKIVSNYAVGFDNIDIDEAKKEGL